MISPCRLKEKSKFVLHGAYGEKLSGYQVFRHNCNFDFKHGGVIPEVELAYETWGELNEAKDNAVILHGGLSASSHAKSHKVPETGLVSMC